MIRTRRATYALVAALAIATVACSSDSSSSSAGSTSSTTSTSSASTPDTSTSSEVTGTVKDYSITLDPTDATAGQVKFTITNEGPSTHEFVVVKTDTAPGDLPVDGALVSEDGIDVIGEAEDIAPSTTADLVLTLEEGQYVVICNIEGHYSQGMNAGLTVTAA